MMALAAPNCGLSWNLLAGIGRIESLHANNGATDARGTAVRPIYGPTLDGSLAGNETIVQSMAPNGMATYARAMGPMQFLPGTWARYASDGDGDGKADPQNLFDSALAAGRYLCSGGLNLRDQSQVLSAILRYNNSMPYARNVLGWAAAYATGVIPMDLPPITGSVPPMGDVRDAHMENGPEGLGPGLPVNVLGMSPNDPMSQMQLVNFASTDIANQMPAVPPGMDPSQYYTTQSPGCPTLVCFGASSMPAFAPGAMPPFGLPGQQAPALPGMTPMPGQMMPGPGMGNLPGPGIGNLPGPAPAVGTLPGPAPAMGTLPGPAPAMGTLPGPAPAAPQMPGQLPASPGMPQTATPQAPTDQVPGPVPPSTGPLPGPAN
jgi:hypothetical protein